MASTRSGSVMLIRLVLLESFEISTPMMAHTPSRQSTYGNVCLVNAAHRPVQNTLSHMTAS